MQTDGVLRGLLLLAAVASLAATGAQAAGGRARGSHTGLIAFAHLGADARRFQIFAVTPSGTHLRQLTRSRRLSSFSPSFSPNGRQIVFVRSYKHEDLWTMTASGRHARRLTRTKQVDETDPAWSPDGKEIAFAVKGPVADEGIWVVGRDGRNRFRLTTGVDTHPTWSPDGSRIAFQRYSGAVNAQSWQIYVVPAGGGAAIDLSNDLQIGDTRPSWSPDGSRILFASDRDNQYQLDLWTMTPDGGSLRRVTDTPNRDEAAPAWSPDGKRIVYSGVSSSSGAASSQLYVSRSNGSHRRVLTHSCGDCAIANEDPSWQPRGG